GERRTGETDLVARLLQELRQKEGPVRMRPKTIHQYAARTPQNSLIRDQESVLGHPPPKSLRIVTHLLYDVLWVIGAGVHGRKCIASLPTQLRKLTCEELEPRVCRIGSFARCGFTLPVLPPDLRRQVWRNKQTPAAEVHQDHEHGRPRMYATRSQGSLRF